MSTFRIIALKGILIVVEAGWLTTASLSTPLLPALFFWTADDHIHYSQIDGLTS